MARKKDRLRVVLDTNVIFEVFMQIDIHIDYFEEDDVIVALCPLLQVSSFGDTLDEAEKSIREALELFFDGCRSLGTLDDILNCSRKCDN